MLTGKQKEIFDIIRDFIEKEKISPTVREVCEISGLASTSTVYGYIKRLEKKGYIYKDSNKPRSIRISENKYSRKSGFKMKTLKCKECKKEINDKMDSYYLGNICEFFCSKNCITEYCIREMEIQKVDTKNIRQVCDIVLFKNGKLYKSNIKDDVCYNCKGGIYKFWKIIKGNDIDYEIYKCNKCGNEMKIKCD